LNHATLKNGVAVLVIVAWTCTPMTPHATARPAQGIEFEGAIYQYDKFPEEVLEGKSPQLKRLLLENWKNLDSGLREQVFNYYSCKKDLGDGEKELAAAEQEKSAADQEYQAAQYAIKNVLVKALARLAMMTGVVLTDALSDFQAGLKKAKESLNPSSADAKPSSVEGAKKQAEMLAEFDRQIERLKAISNSKFAAGQQVTQLERKIYEASVKLYKPEPVDRSTPDKYERYDPANPVFFSEGEVRTGQGFLPDGELHLNLRNKMEDGSRGLILRGSEEFKNILEHFKGRFGGIRGDWQFGDNLAEFNKGLSKRLSPEQAALATWTGQQAKAAGYSKVIIRELAGSPGSYTHVEVTFVRP